MEAKDFDEVSLTIRLPRHIRDEFKKVVRENQALETTVVDTLTSYMIQTIGNHNKHVRQASKGI